MAEADTVSNTQSTNARPTAPNPDEGSPNPAVDPHSNATSLSDNGLSNRPRDARLLHMVLASYGVMAYQERVPLMLMDFAYRYTSATLSDALHFSSEGYGYGGGGGGGGRGASNNTLSDITLPALRLSIHSRSHYQYSPTLPTSMYHEIGGQRNTVALPPLKKEWGSMLPPEQYCLMGNGFRMEDGEDAGDDDITMKDEAEGEGDDVGGEDVEGGTMEDVFGESVNGAGREETEE